MSDKTLSNTELELTQKIQMHFPRGVISPDVLRQWNSCFAERITSRLIEAFSSEPEKIATEYLKLISGGESLILPACNGTRIIPEMTDLFKAGIDSDFRNYPADKKGPATGETPVSVFELVKNGFFAQIFGSLFGASIANNASGGDIAKFIERHRRALERVCFSSHDQIISFVEKYPNWLHPNGWATLFPYQSGREFFFANVHVSSFGFDARVLRFESSDVWRAGSRGRVVVPQLA